MKSKETITCYSGFSPYFSPYF